MPIYEYKCRSCNERTEAIQSFDDPPLTVCPHCGGELEKLMSAPAFQFKGTGWYVTDYAGKGKRPAGESSTKGERAETPGKGDGGSSSADKSAGGGTSADD